MSVLATRRLVGSIIFAVHDLTTKVFRPFEPGRPRSVDGVIRHEMTWPIWRKKHGFIK